MTFQSCGGSFESYYTSRNNILFLHKLFTQYYSLSCSSQLSLLQQPATSTNIIENIKVVAKTIQQTVFNQKVSRDFKIYLFSNTKQTSLIFQVLQISEIILQDKMLQLQPFVELESDFSLVFVILHSSCLLTLISFKAQTIQFLCPT